MARQINFFDGASSSTTPTIGNIVASNLVQYANDAAYEATEVGAPVEGNIYYNTTDNVIRYYNGTSWISIVDETTVQTIENKTIDGTDATGNNTVTNDATDVSYDNASSGMAATDAQGAIDEVEGRVDTNEADIDDLETLSGSPGATDHGTFTGTTIPDNSDTKESLQSLETSLESKIDSSEKGAANGVAELDGTGRLPNSQLPVTAMEFQGSFDASGGGSGSPSLTDGSGSTGDFYRVSAAGTVDHGAGNVTYAIGDSVIYNGTVWEKYDEETLGDTDSLPEGSVNFYYTDTKVDTRIGLASVDDLSDVDTTTDTPLVGEALTWDGSNWVPGEGGGGGGSGFKNYYDAYGDFEIVDDVSEPTTFNDPGGYADGDGGTVAGLSVSHETGADKLAGDGSLQIDKAATDSSEDGVTFLTRTIDRADLGRQLYGSFEIDASDANYTSGDLIIKAYDVTNAAELPVVADDATIPNNKGKILFKVIPSSTTESIRVSLYLESDSATGSAWAVYLDDLRLGPDQSIQTAIITPWESFTPTGSWTSNVTYTGVKRRVGEELECRVHLQMTGTPGPTASTTLTIDVPDGLSIDTTKLPGFDRETQLGDMIIDNGGSTLYGYVQYISTTAVRPMYIQDSGNDETGDIIQPNSTRPINFVNGDGLYLTFNTPIEGWSAGALLSSTEALFSTVHLTGYLSSAQTVADTNADTCVFDVVEIDNFNILNTSTGQITVPKDGKYYVYTQTRTTDADLDQGESFGIQITVNSTVFVDSQKEGEATLASPRQQVSAAKLLDLKKGDVVEVKLRNVNIGANLDFSGGSNVTFVSLYSIPDFSAFGVFGETDLVKSGVFTTLTNWTITADQWGDLASIDLTPGEWDIKGSLGLFSSGATTTTDVRLGISSTSGNSDAGLDLGDNYILERKDSTANSHNTLVVSDEGVIVTSPTTYYLKGHAETSIANLQYVCKISARKIK